MLWKIVFKALKSLKWRNDSLGKEFVILADSFPNRKEDLCFLRDSFLFPFEYIHKTQRTQNLIATGKQLSPLFLLQSLASSAFIGEALTSLCQSSVFTSIQKIEERFCSPLSKSFLLQTETKVASLSLVTVIHHSKKALTNVRRALAEKHSCPAVQNQNYFPVLLYVNGTNRELCPYTQCCYSWKTLNGILKGKTGQNLGRVFEAFCNPYSFSVVPEGLQEMSLLRIPSLSPLAVAGTTGSWECQKSDGKSPQRDAITVVSPGK